MAGKLVVGIAGGTCSGKSTLAARLAELAAVPTTVIGLDRFYTRDMDRGPVLTLSDGQLLFNYNHPDAIDAEAACLAIDEAEGVLIVEGLFTLAIASIRDRLDRTVYVHLDADLRALRRLLRDMKGGRLSKDPEFIARYYIECARVGHELYVEPTRGLAELTVIGDTAGLEQALPNLLSILRA